MALKQQTKAPTNGAPTVTRAPIRVQTLEYPHHQNFPGKTYSQTVTSQGKASTSQWEIDYLPWQRCFRVAFMPPGSDTPEAKNVRFFSEVGACWSLTE